MQRKNRIQTNAPKVNIGSPEGALDNSMARQCERLVDITKNFAGKRCIALQDSMLTEFGAYKVAVSYSH